MRQDEFIEAVEDRLGLTHTELGDMLGTSYQTVYRWRRGASIPFDDLWRMLDACGWLTVGEDVPTVASSPQQLLTEIAARLAQMAESQEQILAALAASAAGDGSGRASRPKTQKQR